MDKLATETCSVEASVGFQKLVDDAVMVPHVPFTSSFASLPVTPSAFSPTTTQNVGHVESKGTVMKAAKCLKQLLVSHLVKNLQASRRERGDERIIFCNFIQRLGNSVCISFFPR